MKFFSYCATIALFVIVSLNCKAISITESAGWFESAYIKFTLDSNYDGYNVYVKGGQYSNFTKIDDMLVRRYANYGRADVVGLKASTYTMKVVPTKKGTEQSSAAVTSSSLTVIAHDRAGFAFKGSQTPGAYDSNGQLKSNALVIYITDKNKDNVKVSITTDKKGTKQECTGLLNILTCYKSGYETRPIAIRFIGNITDMQGINEDDTFKGDIMVSSNKKDCGGITLEGIGNDAVANGWGIRFKGLNYGEIRNLGFMNCDSKEGDDVGLQQDNFYCWVHNCDMFYGFAGKDKDQVKGDGSLDCKKSNYITFSYNHFWDNGKCNLLGLSESVNSYASSPYYITYHHNWYDHSDSRHPRVRYYNAHVYNNYYDGIAKYGAGACLAASVFMEGNYFRNCKYPMMISMQGSDVYAGGTKRDTSNNPTFSNEDGGMIKAYNNYMTGTYTFIPYNASKYFLKGSEVSLNGINSSVDFDAYVVTNKSTKVPNTVVSYNGKNYYSNFDTNSGVMYSYSAQSPSDAVNTIKGSYGAGRLQHGDFTFTFDNSKDDTSSDINTTLKNKMVNYSSQLIGTLNENASYTGGGNETPDTPDTPVELENKIVAGAKKDIHLSAVEFFSWDGFDANATSTSELNNNYGGGVLAEGGTLLYGDGDVNNLKYADLTGCTKLTINGSDGVQVRALFNRQTPTGNDYIEKAGTITDGKFEITLSEVSTSYVHLNAIKTSWGSAAGTISNIYVTNPNSPIDYCISGTGAIDESVTKALSDPNAKNINAFGLVNEQAITLNPVNKNCLIYVNDTKKLTNIQNVVLKNGSNYTATNITLADGGSSISDIAQAGFAYASTSGSAQWAEVGNGTYSFSWTTSNDAVEIFHNLAGKTQNYLVIKTSEFTAPWGVRFYDDNNSLIAEQGYWNAQNAGNKTKEINIDSLFAAKNVSEKRQSLKSVSLYGINNENGKVTINDMYLVTNGSNTFYPFFAPYNITANNVTCTINVNTFTPSWIPFEANIPNGYDAYEIDASNTINKVNKMYPNKPVIIGGKGIAEIKATNVTINATNNLINGNLIGVSEKTQPEIGSYVFLDVNGSEGVAFNEVSSNDGSYVYPLHAYISKGTNSNILKAIGSLVSGEEPEPNALENQTAEKIVIDAIYNISGSKIDNIQQGINIIRMSDGTTKKVLIK